MSRIESRPLEDVFADFKLTNRGWDMSAIQRCKNKHCVAVGIESMHDLKWCFVEAAEKVEEEIKNLCYHCVRAGEVFDLACAHRRY